MKKSLTIWNLMGLYIIYAVISQVLLMLTSGGQSDMKTTDVSLKIYLVVGLILFIVAMVKTMYKKTHITLRPLLLFFVVGTQLATLLLNFGDCDGGSTGFYTFWQRIIYGYNSVCNPGIEHIPGKFEVPFMIMFLIYLVLLCGFLFFTRAVASPYPKKII